MRQKKWAAFEEFVRTHGDSLVRLSYVPVREISSLGVGLQHTLVFNESWVPRTARLVSLANHPHVPAGFTQVPVGQP